MIKPLLLLLVAGCAATVSSYFLYLGVATVQGRENAQPTEAGLHWLAREYAIEESRMEEIREVHAEFRPRCAEHCRVLIEARDRVVAMSGKASADRSALEKAQAEVSRIEAECYRMSLDHIDQVAGLLGPEEGSRYRVEMRQRLAGLSQGHHRIFQENIP